MKTSKWFWILQCLFSIVWNITDQRNRRLCNVSYVVVQPWLIWHYGLVCGVCECVCECHALIRAEIWWPWETIRIAVSGDYAHSRVHWFGLFLENGEWCHFLTHRHILMRQFSFSFSSSEYFLASKLVKKSANKTFNKIFWKNVKKGIKEQRVLCWFQTWNKKVEKFVTKIIYKAANFMFQSKKENLKFPSHFC